MDSLAGLGKLRLPGKEEFRRDRAVRPQQAVSLLQRALIAPPSQQKLMFHVEHAPIQITTTLFGTAGDQCMRARLKAHHGAFTDDLAEACAPSIQARIPARALTPKANPSDPTILMANLTKHGKR
ncbi:hypothetical protein GCM10009429_30540 [Dyella marensis]